MPQLDTVTFFNQALSLFAFFFISLPLFVYSLSNFTSLVSAFRAQTYAGLGEFSLGTLPFSLPSAPSFNAPKVVFFKNDSLKGHKVGLLSSAL